MPDIRRLHTPVRELARHPFVWEHFEGRYFNIGSVESVRSAKEVQEKPEASVFWDEKAPFSHQVTTYTYTGILFLRLRYDVPVLVVKKLDPCPLVTYELKDDWAFYFGLAKLVDRPAYEVVCPDRYIDLACLRGDWSGKARVLDCELDEPYRKNPSLYMNVKILPFGNRYIFDEELPRNEMDLYAGLREIRERSGGS